MREVGYFLTYDFFFYCVRNSCYDTKNIGTAESGSRYNSDSTIYGYHVGTARRANIPKSASVSKNVKILTFDLKSAQKVQNRKISIKKKTVS
jgi:hypothetical protein